MFRKVFSFGVTLLLTGAVALATPGLGLAQRGGGGHGGGGHGGGGHIAGGGHYGGGFGGARYGGYRGGFYPGGGRYGGYGYGYPYYGSYGYYPYSYDTAPYAWSSPTDDSGYSGSYGSVTADGTPSAAPPVSNYQTFYPPVTDTLAHLTVKLPADAQVWVQNTLMTSTGPVRQFISPPLTAGRPFTYEVRAAWNENGHEVTQTQQVGVTAGAYVEVDFPVRPETAGTAPATNGR
jgi:uncharacterized protein (TIGR03000 family)